MNKVGKKLVNERMIEYAKQRESFLLRISNPYVYDETVNTYGRLLGIEKRKK